MSTAIQLITGARRTAQARTAEDVRDRLLKRLDTRKKKIERLEEYYDGDHRLSFASPQFAQTFGQLFEEFADNWCEIVVSAAAERLAVTGFRFAGAGGEADTAAWEIWQRNNLDAESALAMTDAIKLGTSYVFVGADETDGKAVINIDHPADAITEAEPMNPRKVTAGLRRWIDSDGTTFVVLALADNTWTWKRKGGSATGGVWDLVKAEANSLKVVPMVPLRNNPRTTRDRNTGWRERIGVSDIAQVIGLQDAIDKTVVDMLVASEYAGFRQRWVTGIEIPKDPETGASLVDLWKSGASRLWTAESADTKFGEFDVTPLDNYVNAASMLLQHLSAQTRTPPHYLIGQIVNASGDALKAAETGLVAKVKSKQLVFGDDWEDVMRLAFLVEGDTQRASDTSAETIWRDPETRSQAEVTDSVIKLKTIGVPLEILLEEYGYTPQQIARVKEVVVAENLRAIIDNLGGNNDQGDPTTPAVAA